MRKIIYGLSVSLDGFIEATDGDLSWGYPDEELHRHFNEREKDFEILLYGRRLYELMAAYWPTAGENPSAPEVEREYARIWNAKPKVVFSTTLTEVRWNSRLAGADAAGEANRLKSETGGDMIVGGAGLANFFLRLGLVDEVHLYLHPLLLGSGKPMFQNLPGSIRMNLLGTQRFRSGVVLLRYAVIQPG